MYHVPFKMWDEITYPFPNFDGAGVEDGEWIDYFIHDGRNYLSTLGFNYSILAKRATFLCKLFTIYAQPIS